MPASNARRVAGSRRPLVARSRQRWRTACAPSIAPAITRTGKPAESLHGDPLAGAFGGVPVRVQIGPVTPDRPALPPRMPDGAADVRNLVAALADKAEYR